MMSSKRLLKITFLFLPPFVRSNDLGVFFESSEYPVIFIDFKDFVYQIEEKLKEKIIIAITDQDLNKAVLTESDAEQIRLLIVDLINRQISLSENLNSSPQVILRNFPFIIKKAISPLEEQVKNEFFVTATISSIISRFKIEDFENLELSSLYCPSCLEEINNDSDGKVSCSRDPLLTLDLKKLKKFREKFFNSYYNNSVIVAQDIVDSGNQLNYFDLLKSNISGSIKRGLSPFFPLRNKDNK